MSTTVTYDVDGMPRVTLTRDGNFWEATLEIDGLAPQRGTTAEERSAGIISLDPPSIRVRARRKAADTHRELIDAGTRAVSVSATSTLGDTGGPGGLLMSYLRVSRGIREALRLIGEDI